MKLLKNFPIVIDDGELVNFGKEDHGVAFKASRNSAPALKPRTPEYSLKE